MSQTKHRSLVIRLLGRCVRSFRANVSKPAAWRSRQVAGAIRTLHVLALRKAPAASDIPVVINSFNRLSSLKRLVEWLEMIGTRQIIIIDNASTYPPLLDYYKTLTHEIVYAENLGEGALWKLPYLWKRIRSDFYVYTDPDIVPASDCPGDAVGKFLALLISHWWVDKVGFGLRIDDLPDEYEKKAAVLDWEAKHWEREIEPSVFKAGIDTTFALYRPYARGWSGSALRTGFPYVAAHTTWYSDSRNPSPEDVHYANSVRKGISTWLEANGTFANVSSGKRAGNS
jgi:hypothetical protein